MPALRPLLIGAAAGAVSAFVFVIVHHIVISNIWFSLVPMLIAGAVCGLLLGWSYGLVDDRSIGGWIRFNLLYIGAFVLLGIVSVVLFEPTTTMAVVMASEEGLPPELMRQALPLTVGFTIVTAAAVSWLYGRGWLHHGVILVTTAALMAALGINVSPIGLVSMPMSGVLLVLEMFGLIVALNVVYAGAFAIIGFQFSVFSSQ